MHCVLAPRLRACSNQCCVTADVTIHPVLLSSPVALKFYESYMGIALDPAALMLPGGPGGYTANKPHTRLGQGCIGYMHIHTCICMSLPFSTQSASLWRREEEERN
jgi:hypothetical protein